MWRRTRTPAGASPADIAALAARLAVFFQAGLSPQRSWQELADIEGLPDATRRLARAMSHSLESGQRHAEAVAATCHNGAEPERVFSALIVVADESGTPLASALWALADSLRDRVEAENHIRSITTAPRQTTWLLLGLPPLSILVAGMLGVDALGFLTGSGFGWLLLTGAALAYLAALKWMSRLVAQLLPDRGYLSPARDLVAVASHGGALPEVARDRVERVLTDHGLVDGPVVELHALADLSRRVGIPISTLAVTEARWHRHQARAEAAQAAHSLSVRILIPLGLLILPAFVMVGVVPVVFTLLQDALSSDLNTIW